MSTEGSPPREEYFENVPTGVELETVEDSSPSRENSALMRPWDPEKIRVSTRQYSLRNILDMIDEGDLDLAPDFQRNLVWSVGQKSRLIESVLLQIPLPAFYFAEDANGMMRVVDGLQRLSTVRSFVRGGPRGFVLHGLEYLDLDAASFDDLQPSLKRRLHGAQIVVHVIDPTTPSAVKYDIFRRINTGGTPLNSQEIRHCMSGNRSRDFLKRCAQSAEFNLATGMRDHIRMADRELALRYSAFAVLGVEGYVQDGGMDVFLDRMNGMLDDPVQLPDAAMEELYRRFVTSMRISHEVFGEDAFRKYLGVRLNPINRALFESWSIALGEAGEVAATRASAIKEGAVRLEQGDPAYWDAITTSTGDPGRVRIRFDRARAVVTSAVGG